MADYIYSAEQTVLLNDPVLFNDSTPCRKGYVVHDDGDGVFVLRGIVNNPSACNARYQVTFNGNIALPEGGTVAPIAVALTTYGEQRVSSKAIYTPAAVEQYGNVTSTAIINAPRGCCVPVSVEAVAASATDDPAPAILVQNANITITRIA